MHTALFHVSPYKGFNSPSMVGISSQTVVNDDVSAIIARYTGVVEAEVVGIWLPASGHQQMGTGDFGQAVKKTSRMRRHLCF